MAKRFDSQFRRFWEQTRDRVRAYIVCAGGANDADDLAQEVYLRAFRNWDRFDGTGSRQAWLFAIARNTQVDWFRKRGRDARLLIASERRRTDEVTQPNDDDLEMIWQAISHLGPEYREAIHLRFAADLSYAEMAATLGVPIGTVRSRLHRGLRAVREQIEECENGA